MIEEVGGENIASQKALPAWMPKKAKEDIKRLEAERIRERFKPSLKERIISLRYARLNKKTWHMLPFLLLHLLVCAYAEVSSIELVKSASRIDLGPITKIMKRISALSGIGIELDRACEITRRDVKLLYLRDFLQRFAQAAKLGEDLTSFLTKEYNTFMTLFASTLERSLVRLKRFSEAYSAILSSSVFIVVIMIFTGMIWGGGVKLAKITLPVVVLLYAIFAYVFYSGSHIVKVISSGPRNIKIDSLLRFSNLVTKIILAAHIPIVALLSLHMISLQFGVILLTILGLPAFAAGFLGLRITKKIEKLDERFPEFVTMLSTSLSTSGSVTSTLKELADLDFGALSKHVKHLYGLFEIGAENETCWKIFQRDTSSEIMRIHLDILSTGIAYGAPSKKIGPLITSSALFMLTMRRRVEEAGALLKGIVLPMHPILCAVMGLIASIIAQFSELYSGYQASGMPVILAMNFSLANVEPYIFTLIAAATIANAISLYSVCGCREFTLAYYLGILTATGWLAYYFAFTAISAYLQSIGLASAAEIVQIP